MARRSLSASSLQSSTASTTSSSSCSASGGRSRTLTSQFNALVSEQLDLAIHTAGVAAEAAAGAQHAMARHDDRDRVVAQRVAGGPHGERVAGGGRHVAIGAGLAERDPR